MLIAIFRKLAKSKWLQWIGTAPFFAIPLFIMVKGEMWRGLGTLAFIFSMFAGVVIGGFVGGMLNKHVLRQSSKLGERLSAAFSCFGFLFLPPLIGSWTNIYLDTRIEMQSLGAHFLWAAVVGVVFFCAKLSVSKD